MNKNIYRRDTLFIRDIDRVRHKLNKKTVSIDRKKITIEYH